MSELQYRMNGDYLIPDLSLSETTEMPLGKYGRMRKTYLKEHRPVLFSNLLLSEKLYPHLREIDEAAQNRLETMIPKLMEAQSRWPSYILRLAELYGPKDALEEALDGEEEPQEARAAVVKIPSAISIMP